MHEPLCRAHRGWSTRRPRAQLSLSNSLLMDYDVCVALFGWILPCSCTCRKPQFHWVSLPAVRASDRNIGACTLTVFVGHYPHRCEEIQLSQGGVAVGVLDSEWGGLGSNPHSSQQS